MNQRLDLSDVLQEPAARAASLGLYLCHYNSGSKYNDRNGTYIFPGTDERSFSAGGHLAHCGSVKEVNAFLNGFVKGMALQLVDDAHRAAELTTDNERLRDALGKIARRYPCET